MTPCPPTLFSLPQLLSGNPQGRAVLLASLSLSLSLSLSHHHHHHHHHLISCSVGRAEDELVELLWQNGQVFMLSQTHREAVGRPCQKPESAPRCVEPLDPLPHPARNEDASPWVQYLIDDPLMRDFYLDFFHGLPAAESTEARIAVEPTSGHFLEKEGAEFGRDQGGREESSPLAASKWSDIHGSCSSSVKVPSAKGADDSQAGFSYSEIQEAGIASTSDGSALSLRVDDWRSTDTGNYKKRKRKDVDESQCQNEETEDESVEATRPCRRSVPARRARAAQVHNLSERRRRDRINEKMRALQELIPHCNKTDKVSMLDEAIEYLKSLQLQVQVQGLLLLFRSNLSIHSLIFFF
ncbi:unnamed protein product [Spirodela intermedia]|uniref:BHLH domain-containing protein n=1 Tax=Spirodela intermedia TaxID=51605 RepID=A0A7I8L675_SPIIN|nr:unnamed protein product [Spirodela intermedia]